MEQHEPNGRGEDDDVTRQAWSKVTSDFSQLGTKVKAFFEHDEDERGAGEDAQEAIQDLVAAAERAGRSVAAAFRDPDVQQQVKTALGSLIEAIGASAKEIGDRMGATERPLDDEDS